MGKKCFITGWGQNADRKYPMKLQEAEVSLVCYSSFALLAKFGKAITSRNHEIFNPASNLGYLNVWQVDFVKKNLGNFLQFLS